MFADLSLRWAHGSFWLVIHPLSQMLSQNERRQSNGFELSLPNLKGSHSFMKLSVLCSILLGIYTKTSNILHTIDLHVTHKKLKDQYYQS